jgi:hypothetical protein
MVEPVTTITAISLLIAYLKGAAEQAGKQTVDTAEDGARTALKRVYDVVRQRLSRDDYAQQTLARLEAQPGDERRARALDDVLAETTEADPEFAAALTEAVTAATSAGVQVDSSGAIAIGGSVIQHGHNVAGRDLNVGVEAVRHVDG